MLRSTGMGGPISSSSELSADGWPLLTGGAGALLDSATDSLYFSSSVAETDVRSDNYNVVLRYVVSVEHDVVAANILF